jgi:hypothetical protein
MLTNEFILDGFISPHHFFIDTIPAHIKGKHKIKYDIFLDGWGFFNGLLPVLYKRNPYYHIFDKYRHILLGLFIWKIIGYILVYKYKDYRFNLIFQNFFISVYLSVSFCDFFNIQKNKSVITSLFIIAFVLREIYLVSLNKNM